MSEEPLRLHDSHGLTSPVEASGSSECRYFTLEKTMQRISDSTPFLQYQPSVVVRKALPESPESFSLPAAAETLDFSAAAQRVKSEPEKKNDAPQLQKPLAQGQGQAPQPVKAQLPAAINTIPSVLAMDDPSAAAADKSSEELTAAGLSHMAGVDLRDPAKSAMSGLYAGILNNLRKEGLTGDSVQFKALQSVMVANLKEETTQANALHVAEVAGAAGANAAISGMDLKQKAEMVAAALLHDPPNKSSVGGEFLIHNRQSAIRAAELLGSPETTAGLSSPEERKALDRIREKAVRIALTHQEAPSYFMALVTAQTALTEELGGNKGQFFGFFGTLGDVKTTGSLPPPGELRSSLVKMGFAEDRIAAFFEKKDKDGLSPYDNLASIVSKIAHPRSSPLKEVSVPGLGEPVHALQFNPGEERLLSHILTSARKDMQGKDAAALQKLPDKFEWFVSDLRDSDYKEEAVMIASDGEPNYTEPGGFLKMMPVHKGYATMDDGFQSIYGDKGSYGVWKNQLPSDPSMPWAAKIVSRAVEKHDRTAAAYESMKKKLLDPERGSFAAGWRPDRPKAGSKEERIILARYNEAVKNNPNLPRITTLRDAGEDVWKSVQSTYQDSLIRQMYDGMKAEAGI